MPYAKVSTIPVHMPARRYAHYAFLSESITVERRFIDFCVVEYNTTIKAGIYGFTNLSERDNFISIANRSSENEVAFIASMV